MPDVTLYQAPVCPYARRTRMTLEELGIPYENKQIDLEQVPESYTEISPYGLVPAIVHDDKNVYESNIINEYLNEAFDGGLMPDDAHGRAKVRIMMAYADDPWMGDFGAWSSIVTGKREAGMEELEEARDQVVARLRHLDDFIADHGGAPWLYGDSLTLADIAFATTLPFLEDHGLAIPEELNNIQAWLEAVTGLESWNKVPTEPEPDVETVTA